MSVYRKDDNGNIKKIAGSLTQRINMHIFQTTHEFDTEKNEDNYIINESDAKPYISSIKDWTQYSINLSEPNKSSNINIKLGSQTLKLINSVKNIEIGTLNGVIQCHTEKLDNNEIFLDVVGTVVSLNGVEKTSINTDTTPTANSNNLITSGGVHDYPAITFAESERQKSKNLFPFGNVSGTKQVQRFISLPAGTYTLSAIATSSDTDANTCLVGFYNKTDEWIGGNQLTRGSRQSITVSLAQPTFSIYFFASNNQSNSEGDTFTFADIQIEEGSVATDYQPYNGQISHSGDKEIEFARNEYEKSKNLWNSEDIKIGYDRVTYNKDTNTFTYTVTSAIVGENTEMAILSYGKLKAGNYIVSFTATSSIGNDAPIIVCELDSNNNFVTSIGTIYFIDGYKTIPFSLTEEKRIGLAWYYKAGWIAGDAPAGTKTLTNIQLEEGSIATNFQPYNGQISHSGDKEIEFAESERQKSKNLWGSELQKGCYLFADGTLDKSNDAYVCNKTLISIKPNSTITISATSFEINNDSGFVFFKDGQYVGYSRGVVSIMVPSNANQVAFNFYKTGVGNDFSLISNIQLEYGSVATDYQPYNGQISHTGDKEIEFARDEYEKSKNLIPFPYYDGNSKATNGIVFTVNNDQSISVSGTIIDHTSNAVMWLAMDMPLKAGTYRISDSSPGDDLGIVAQIGDGYYSDEFTLSSDATARIYLQVVMGSTKTYNDTVKFMLCEGTDTDWQPYNGEIIHKRSLNEIVNGKYPIDINDCTTYDQVFNKLQNAVYGKCGIGVNHTSAIKSLLPTFPTNVGYVDCVANVIKNKYTTSASLYAIRFTGCPFGVNQPIYYCDVFYDGENTIVTGWYKPETVELIYDINTKNTIGGTEYREGLAVRTTYSIDFTAYKKLKVYTKQTHENSIIMVDLTQSNINNSGYNGAVSLVTGVFDAIDNILVQIPLTKNTLTFDCKYLKFAGLTLTNGDSIIYRLEGYK